MRQINEVGYELCKFQAGLFEASINYIDCSSAYFYRQFMNSFIAKRMDDINFIFEGNDIYATLDELKKEKDLTKGNIHLNKAVMIWSGYLLRYWCYIYEISSKKLFKYIKLNELNNLYEAYHSLDIEEAINRISEAKNIKYASSFDDQLYLLKQVKNL